MNSPKVNLYPFCQMSMDPPLGRPNGNPVCIPIPIHWQAEVNFGLNQDVALGIIELELLPQSTLCPQQHEELSITQAGLTKWHLPKLGNN